MRKLLSIVLALLPLAAFAQRAEEVGYAQSYIEGTRRYYEAAFALHCPASNLQTGFNVLTYRDPGEDDEIVRARTAALVIARAAAVDPSCSLTGADVVFLAKDSAQIWAGKPRTQVIFFNSVAANTIGGSNTCNVAATNMGTPTQIGMAQIVDVTGYRNARIIARAATATGQSGTISCRLWSITRSAALVTVAVTNTTTCTLATETATSANYQTGPEIVRCECVSSTATDDPLFSYCAAEFWP